MATRQTLIDSIAEDKNMTKHKTLYILNTILNTILNNIIIKLKKDGVVQISGFGTFSVKTRPARTGRNPRTGEVITVPERRTIKFSPTERLIEEVGLNEQGVINAKYASGIVDVCAAVIKQRNELLEALKQIANAENSALDLAYCKGIARAAIAKAAGVANEN